MPSLYLIPTSLDPAINRAALLVEQLPLIQQLRHFIVETAKVGRAHLKQLNLATPLQQLSIMELNKHKHDLSALIAPLRDGHDLGLLADCGCPAVADPGNRIVSIAHELGFTLKPLVGPSSIMLSLMASGLNGQKFAFLGYLPSEPRQRSARLKELQQEILLNASTQIFIEAPFRNQKLFQALCQELQAEIKLCLAINLMTPTQQIITKSIHEWQDHAIDLHKQEVIFLIGCP